MEGPQEERAYFMAQKKGEQLLLATKLIIPPTFGYTVQRERLYSLLEKGVQGPLTLLVSPAGFGKTTLLSHWTHQREGPVAWVTLDRSDNNPLCFWRYVIATLEHLHPLISEQTRQCHSSTCSPNIKAVLIQLINALLEIPQPVILVLDNYQCITNPAIHSSITFLLEHLPPQLHLILASRTEPPLPLTRLYMRRQAVKLRASQLLFTQEEAATLSLEQGRPCSSEALADMYRYTGGWAAGLASALQEIDSSKPLRQMSAGQQHYVFTYLREEVLAQLPQDLQAFAFTTSILDRLNAPLCDAVTRHPSASTFLDRLTQAGTFLFPLDEHSEWLSYQPLFRQVLQHQLQQQHPSSVAELHQRASTWYEEQGFASEAIQHALAASAFEQAIRLIENAALPLLYQGKEPVVYHWLSQLPDNIITSRPLLSFLSALCWLANGNFIAYEQALQRAEEACHMQNRTELLSWTYTLRASAALLRGQGSQAVALSHKALSLLASEHDPLHGSVMVILGAGYLHTAELAQAHIALNEGYRLAQQHHHLIVMLQAILHLGEVQLLQGHLHQAARTFRRLLSKEQCPAWLQIGAYLRLGEIYLEKNDLEQATRQWQQAQSLLEEQETSGFDRPRSALLAARLAYVRGECEQVMTWLDLAEQEAHRLGSHPTLLAHIDELRTQALLAQDVQVAIGDGIWNISEIEEKDQPYACEAMIRQKARLALSQGRPGEACALLEAELAEAQTRDRSGSLLKLLLLLALAYEAQGRRQLALEALQRALALGEHGGYLRAFIDEGTNLAALLIACVSHAQKQESQKMEHAFSLEYVRQIMAELRYEMPAPFCARVVPHVSPQELIEPLSEREQDVLMLIAAGLSNQEIAYKLVVTVSTVKTHLNNIYAKFGVHTRLQAVTTAYELRLLKKAGKRANRCPPLIEPCMCS